MPDYDPTHKHSHWITVSKYLGTFLIGVVVASFSVGGARQRVTTLGKDMDEWKTAWRETHAPRIERMDRAGTTSFDLFHQEYLRTQSRQEEKLKELEKEIKELQRKP